jgi:uncharacterized protein YndB with AHSA1/START domain
MIGGSIEFTHAFECSAERLWQALVAPDELSAWLGGACSIDARVGGRIRFDVPSERVHASGAVRLVAAPQPDHSVAVLEHTFVDDADAGVTSVCRWAVHRSQTGCELAFTHDGFGEADRARLEAWWAKGLATSVERSDVTRPTTSLARATALLRDARRIVLVSFIGSEVPDALLEAGFDVFAKVGPQPDAWAHCRRAGVEFSFDRCATPNDIDLVHLDVPAFDEYLEVARALGAKTLWFHSARTCPPEPHDDRGCWLPASQSARQRDAALAAGLEYVDDRYIADVARTLQT